MAAYTFFLPFSFKEPKTGSYFFPNSSLPNGILSCFLAKILSTIYILYLQPAHHAFQKEKWAASSGPRSHSFDPLFVLQLQWLFVVKRSMEALNIFLWHPAYSLHSVTNENNHTVRGCLNRQCKHPKHNRPEEIPQRISIQTQNVIWHHYTTPNKNKGAEWKGCKTACKQHCQVGC